MSRGLLRKSLVPSSGPQSSAEQPHALLCATSPPHLAVRLGNYVHMGATCDMSNNPAATEVAILDRQAKAVATAASAMPHAPARMPSGQVAGTKTAAVSHFAVAAATSPPQLRGRGRSVQMGRGSSDGMRRGQSIADLLQQVTALSPQCQGHEIPQPAPALPPHEANMLHSPSPSADNVLQAAGPDEQSVPACTRASDIESPAQLANEEGVANTGVICSTGLRAPRQATSEPPSKVQDKSTSPAQSSGGKVQLVTRYVLGGPTCTPEDSGEFSPDEAVPLLKPRPSEEIPPSHRRREEHLSSSDMRRLSANKPIAVPCTRAPPSAVQFIGTRPPKDLSLAPPQHHESNHDVDVGQSQSGAVTRARSELAAPAAEDQKQTVPGRAANACGRASQEIVPEARTGMQKKVKRSSELSSLPPMPGEGDRHKKRKVARKPLAAAVSSCNEPSASAAASEHQGVPACATSI